jgi:ribosomal protein S18 acetylase RimI-like enzyme
MTTAESRDDAPPSAVLPEGYRLSRADASHRRSALAAIVAPGQRPSDAQVTHFIQFAESRDLSLESLWYVTDPDQQVIAAALAIPSPGRTAMAFVSPVSTPEQHDCAAAALDRASRGCPEVHLAQGLLEPGQVAQREAFLRAGFTELATLSYLERPVPRKPPPPVVDWPVGIEVDCWRQRDDIEMDRFGRALDASYVDTLDCPGLCGLRDTRDVLEGHLSTGTFVPELWTVVSFRGRPAGVALFSPIPERRVIELIYIGIAPEVRGGGLGRRLMLHAFRQLAGRPERAISLAVDESNVPALGLYDRLRFQRTARRVALIRSTRGYS